MLIERGQVEDLKLPQEEVAVASLNGSVIVRGLLLSQRLGNDAWLRSQRKPLDGETESDASARAGALLLPRVLGQCVFDAAGLPLKTSGQWDIFGALHWDDACLLFNTAMRLSGQDQDAVEKN